MTFNSSGGIPRSLLAVPPGLRAPPDGGSTPLALPVMVVAIPARDEQERLGRTLRALGEQVGETPESLRVVVLANNCTDDTAVTARRVSAHSPFTTEIIEEDFPPESAHVGRARGRALELAAERLRVQGTGLLATTDADTVPAPDWARRMRLALCGWPQGGESPGWGGADVVGGRILTLPEERAQLSPALRRLQLQDAAYHLLASQLESRLAPDPHDPWPRHHQHFGANLGMRLSAFQQMGAWPEVRCLEDVALIQAMRRLDMRVRHCPQVRVWTSVREYGRVETGLSSQLREWSELRARGGDWTVPGADELRAAAKASAALRQAWKTKTLPEALAGLWLVEPDTLMPAVQALTFGTALELATEARHRDGRWWRRYPAVPLEDALHALRRMLG